jgi:hypothetical protein
MARRGAMYESCYGFEPVEARWTNRVPGPPQAGDGGDNGGSRTPDGAPPRPSLREGASVRGLTAGVDLAGASRQGCPVWRRGEQGW